MFRFALAFGAVALFATPMAANAQGLIGGAQQGAAAGDRALGPIGGIVGGAVGAGVGTVNGALGINPGYEAPRPYYGPAHRRYRHCHYRHHRRYCRY